jgi:uncharacterized protein Smg (DUF494 family)
MVQEKVIEIIVYLLAELKNNKQLGDIDLQSLSNMGYTQSEINSAFSWIYSKIHTGEKVFRDEKRTGKSHRFLHDLEKNMIEPDAFGYLVELKELGLLNELDVEMILEKIMLSGYTRVSLKDIKNITAGYLLDVNEMTNHNKRIIINPDDSVN